MTHLIRTRAETPPVTIIVRRGVCMVCGCTESHPCALREHRACLWVDDDHTLCTGLSCLQTVRWIVQRLPVLAKM